MAAVIQKGRGAEIMPLKRARRPPALRKAAAKGLNKSPAAYAHTFREATSTICDFKARKYRGRAASLQPYVVVSDASKADRQAFLKNKTVPKLTRVYKLSK